MPSSYQRFFTSLPLPALVVDELGFIQQANRRASELLSLSHEVALQHKSVLLYLGPEPRRQLQWCLSHHNRHEGHEMSDVLLRLGQGVNRPFNLHITQLELEDDANSPLSLLVFVDQSPVQEQRLSEERYRLQTQRLAEVIWASQSGFWEWDVTQVNLQCNERWAEIHGYTLDELTPITLKAWMAMVHPQDSEELRALRRNFLKADLDSFDIRLRVAHKLGGWVWVHNRGRVIERDEYGKPSRVAGALVEISDEMAQAQALQAAKLAAEEAQRINTEFMANLSHEIRTPLNSVLGLIQLLHQSPLEAAQKSLVDEIGQSGEMLSRTLNELLDHAKLEAGGVALERKPLRLRELLGTAMVMFNHAAQKAGITLTAQVSPEVPDMFLGDSLRLQQVIHNLMSNAIKFTERGGVSLDITRLAAFPSGDVVLHIEVKDTGIGIAQIDQAKLFTPFFQSDASITRRYGGTGLGLSICRRLVSLMGGEIGVESQPGRGSRFWFTAHFKAMPQEAGPVWVPSEWHLGDPAPTPATPLVLDPTQQTSIEVLEDALKKHDIQALDLAQTMLQGMTASHQDFFRTLKNKLEVYDFHGALRELQSVKAQQVRA